MTYLEIEININIKHSKFKFTKKCRYIQTKIVVFVAYEARIGKSSISLIP